MKKNELTIVINKPVKQVFRFAITPPNSARWIPGVVKEETSEWPVRVGTVYKLTDKTGSISGVTVVDIKEKKKVEWVSSDGNYHCRYRLKSLSQNITELEYSEWVDKGELEGPFTKEVLSKLKNVLESVNGRFLG